MKKGIIKDERILTQSRKIGSEACQLAYLGIFASIIIQQYIFKAPFLQYAAECVLLVTLSLYIVIRNVIVGIDIFYTATSGQKLIVVYSLICGIIVALGIAVFNDNLFKVSIFNAFIVVFITFLFSTFSTFIVLEFFYKINKNRQENIETNLNDDANE